MLTFEQAHHEPIAQWVKISKDAKTAVGYRISDLSRQIDSLSSCLEQMRAAWDGEEHTLVEMYPGYDPPWMYDDEMQVDDDGLYTICPVCDYGIDEDEYINECPTCEKGMCLYCYEGRPCPDHGEED